MAAAAREHDGASAAAALEEGLEDPGRVDFVGMHGSVHVGHKQWQALTGRGAQRQDVRMDVAAARKALEATSGNNQRLLSRRRTARSFSDRLSAGAARLAARHAARQEQARSHAARHAWLTDADMASLSHRLSIRPVYS